MSHPPSPAAVKLLQFLVLLRQQQLRNQRGGSRQADESPPPPYSRTESPYHQESSPSRPTSIGRDSLTSTITFNTAPHIHGSGNQYLLPVGSTSNSPASFSPGVPETNAPSSFPATTSPLLQPIPPDATCNVPAVQNDLGNATRQAAILLAAVQRLNCNTTERNTSLERPAGAQDVSQRTPYLRVDVIVNTGITIVGNDNVIGLDTPRGGEIAETRAKKRKRKADNEGESNPREEGEKRSK
ncbi:Hypothetical protein D9617_65g035140 [Elsinoe fawcettii]|nr:Hypothetical protein D9617_65g035140 [Elsinoe fawcettii]